MQNSGTTLQTRFPANRVYLSWAEVTLELQMNLRSGALGLGSGP